LDGIHAGWGLKSIDVDSILPVEKVKVTNKWRNHHIQPGCPNSKSLPNYENALLNRINAC